MSLQEFQQKSKAQKKSNEQFYKKLRSNPPKDLDHLFQTAHEEVFEQTDCLACANCCKTTSPVFYQRDVERASKALRIKPGAFIERFLRIDEDNDLVLKSSPCTFLDPDNRCSIYDSRPVACREYPHTNRKKISQLLELTMANTLVCPAVLKITERLRELKIA